MVTVAEPGVEFVTMLPVPVSQVVRNRLSKDRFSDSPLPSEAFARALNGVYCVLNEFVHGLLCAEGGEKSALG